MRKKIDLDYLVGAAEIVQCLNIKRPHLIHDWRRRYLEFPKPIVELTGILPWDQQNIERWAAKSQGIL